MQIQLIPGPGEPTIGKWDLRDLEGWCQGFIFDPPHNPVIIGIDGRGGSGKSTLAARIQTSLANLGHEVSIVATDDIAWHHSILSWHPLLVEHVLNPVRRGEPVDYRPDAWVERGRQGAIQVSADARVVIVEGTGTLHESVLAFLNRSIWVQSDYDLARERALDRDVASGVNGNREEASEFWEHWQREEVPYLVEHKPWLQADVIVRGVARETAPPGSIFVADTPNAS